MLTNINGLQGEIFRTKKQVGTCVFHYPPFKLLVVHTIKIVEELESKKIV
jgi:hypothetical protein